MRKAVMDMSQNQENLRQNQDPYLEQPVFGYTILHRMRLKGILQNPLLRLIPHDRSTRLQCYNERRTWLNQYHDFLYIF